MTSKTAHYKNNVSSAEETKKKYSLIFNEWSIKPDKQSSVLRENLFNVVLRLAQAHVSPTDAGKVSHILCFHY